jgi:hypothetical protein
MQTVVPIPKRPKQGVQGNLYKDIMRSQRTGKPTPFFRRITYVQQQAKTYYTIANQLNINNISHILYILRPIYDDIHTYKNTIPNELWDVILEKKTYFY